MSELNEKIAERVRKVHDRFRGSSGQMACEIERLERQINSIASLAGHAIRQIDAANAQTNLGEFWAAVDPETLRLKLIGNDPVIFITPGPHKNPSTKHVRVRIVRIDEPE